jgi:fucose 4-O-acetylase-like acetyltransferase
MKRDSYFDILKGIGIISVVIGHACCDYHFLIFKLIDMAYYRVFAYTKVSSEVARL